MGALVEKPHARPAPNQTGMASKTLTSQNLITPKPKQGGHFGRPQFTHERSPS